MCVCASRAQAQAQSQSQSVPSKRQNRSALPGRSSFPHAHRPAKSNPSFVLSTVVSNNSAASLVSLFRIHLHPRSSIRLAFCSPSLSSPWYVCAVLPLPAADLFLTKAPAHHVPNASREPASLCPEAPVLSIVNDETSSIKYVGARSLLIRPDSAPDSPLAARRRRSRPTFSYCPARR